MLFDRRAIVCYCVDQLAKVIWFFGAHCFAAVFFCSPIEPQFEEHVHCTMHIAQPTAQWHPVQHWSVQFSGLENTNVHCSAL